MAGWKAPRQAQRQSDERAEAVERYDKRYRCPRSPPLIGGEDNSRQGDEDNETHDSGRLLGVDLSVAQQAADFHAKVPLPGKLTAAARAHRGRLTSTLSPPSSRLPKATSPPWALMIVRATVRPSPTPPVSRFRDASSLRKGLNASS